MNPFKPKTTITQLTHTGLERGGGGADELISSVEHKSRYFLIMLGFKQLMSNIDFQSIFFPAMDVNGAHQLFRSQHFDSY